MDVVAGSKYLWYLWYLWYLITGGAIEKMYKEDGKIIGIVQRGNIEQETEKQYEW